jgi:hypothetical protein
MLLLVDWKILQQDKGQPNRGATKYGERPNTRPSLNPKLRQNPYRGGGGRRGGRKKGTG